MVIKDMVFWHKIFLNLEGEDNVIIDNEQPDSSKISKVKHLVPILVNAIKELQRK
jgi:hypothetical protein